MRPKLTKRACDECITRKVKCSGAWPCDTCRSALKQVKCTYLKPARRRGPKVRRHTGKIDSESSVSEADASTSLDVGASNESHDGHRTISRPVLETVVHWYQHSSYSVWPVIDAEVLLRRLAGDSGHDPNIYCLATGLCAATMAQLQLPPLTDDVQIVDCAAMASECMRLREASNYRENLDMKSILVSFFLHVYHAKINKRNSAMMFIQEAISGARLLKLDEWDCETRAGGDEVIANEDILFTLLWISERGYAMHLGLLPSYTSPIRLPGIYSAGNEHAQGLLELARLFAAFDSVSLKRGTGALNPGVISTDCLTETEAALSMLSLGEGGRASVRMADYCITKEWMRTIIWQEALSRQMLSSKAYAELLTFKFPARVSRDLLYSLQGFSEFDLLPLGRDQVW
ncbi:C6 transcription factor [Aspergillus bombycis]|uniref:C6 transcription factor n=1 Tax=Aspergillus bombycis TaxID=109264 RepID=A0A1F8AFR2_9EURO|nr:C6 transcription factor [Aspergillus bombycis]OGM50502.1 C6 transcription factor [Aspergillus bombycis]